MTLFDMPEAILRRIWQEQAFTKDHLATSDGRSVRILSPGTTNTDGGPDFLDAKIAIGPTTYLGDVELHINAAEWLAHKHDADPHYNRVILHVVMSAEPLAPPARTASRRAIPLLVLHPFLDETVHRAWEKALFGEQVQPGVTLACHGMNDAVPSATISGWIEKLGRERIELKVRRFEERLKQLIDEARHVVREPYPRYYGNPSDIPPPKTDYRKKDFTDRALWEQLLYEGVMEALGYAKNTQPFVRLARSMRLHTLRRHDVRDAHTMMALLFGAAGLIPSAKSISEKAAREYAARLRMRWNDLRTKFKGQLLNEGDWLFFRMRPGNFPTARLAAMCFALPRLFGEGSFRSLIGVFKSEALSTKQRKQKLHEMFLFEPDEFWQSHYHFKGRKGKSVEEQVEERSGRARTTFGAARVYDIMVNVIIPVVLLYARHFNDNAVRRNARLLLAHLRPEQENSVALIMQQQLLKRRVDVDSSLREQGAIHLYRLFCSHLRCAECAVGRTMGLSSMP